MNKTFKRTYNNNTLKYWQLNKFFYKTTKKFSHIKKIVVSFDQKSIDFKQIIMSNLALEILFLKKSIITTTKKPNLLLKIKKNQPTGCKLIFNNTVLITQVLKLIFEIGATNEYSINLKIDKKKFFTLTTNILEVYNFRKLEDYFLLFNKLKNLNVSIVNKIKNNNFKEIKFLISLYN
jgi:hypothetical protein